MHVIPAKAGIQGVFVSKSFCGIERFWIPAFAGMTEIKLSHVSESYLTTLPSKAIQINETSLILHRNPREAETGQLEGGYPGGEANLV